MKSVVIEELILRKKACIRSEGCWWFSPWWHYSETSEASVGWTLSATTSINLVSLFPVYITSTWLTKRAPWRRLPRKKKVRAGCSSLLRGCWPVCRRLDNRDPSVLKPKKAKARRPRKSTRRHAAVSEYSSSESDEDSGRLESQLVGMKPRPDSWLTWVVGSSLPWPRQWQGRKLPSRSMAMPSGSKPSLSSTNRFWSGIWIKRRILCKNKPFRPPLSCQDVRWAGI